MTKIYIVLVFLAFFAYNAFLLHFANNNDDQGPWALLNSIFATKINCITKENLKFFVLKIAISGPDLTFSWT